MRKFKVIALSCGTERRSKPFEFGDIVTDADFAIGMAEQREKEGFLQEIKEDQEPKESLLEKTPDQVSLADLANMSEDEKTGQPLIDDVTKKQIMEALTEKNIPFSANDSKEILYNLMIAIK